MSPARRTRYRRRESALAILLTAMRLWETRAMLQKSRRVLAAHLAPR
jgi:hypothetical protein